ncbi:MAG: CehA/McbA family metallohydrolase [Myxococcota bacterium]
MSINLSSLRFLAVLPIAACGSGSGGAVTGDGGAPSGDAGVTLDDGVDPGVPAAPGEARAGRVTIDSAHALIAHDSAEGKPGDFLLYNACARFVIQDARPGNGYAASPGAVIDADIVRPDGARGHDLIDELVTVFGVTSTFEADEVGVLDDGGKGGAAVVRAVGGDTPLEIITGLLGGAGQPQHLEVVQDYLLAPDSCVLEIRTRVVARGTHTSPLGIGDFVVLSNDHAAGFVDGAGFASGSGESATWGGAVEDWGQLATTVFAPAGRRLGSAVGSLIAALGGTGIFLYWIDEPELGTDETVEIVRYLAVGPDVASTTRDAFAIRGEPGLSTVRGVVRDSTGDEVAGARVHLVRVDGGKASWVTAAASGQDGAFAASVPAGDYDVVAVAEDQGREVARGGGRELQLPFAAGREPSAPVRVTASAGVEATANPVLGRAGAVDLTIVDGSGAPSPARAIFSFSAGDPSPPDAMLGERDYASAKKTFWTVDGRIQGALAPGTYDLVVTHGFDAELDLREAVVVPDGGTLVIDDLVVADVVDHAGYLSVDTHVHAAASLDGECPNVDRVGTIMGEGLDFFVSSDHDFVVDYGPAILEMGVAERLSFVFAEEVSPPFAGHFNPFPIVQLDAPSGGAVRWWSGGPHTTDTLFGRMRDDLAAELIQINHGRRNSGFFAASGWDPATGTIGDPFFWSDDFDLMEIMNSDDYGQAEELLRDWYSLLNLGRRIVGTGVSDEHGFGWVGFSRTYVALDESNPAALLPEEVADGFRSGNAIVSAGPFLEVAIDGQPPGADVDGSAGEVTLTVEVRAPSWMPVDAITIVGNGVALATIEAAAPDPPVWLAETIALTLTADTWVVVRADGASDLAPALPGKHAFAVSNPIFVDADGNGFQAPGLGE